MGGTGSNGQVKSFGAENKHSRIHTKPRITVFAHEVAAEEGYLQTFKTLYNHPTVGKQAATADGESVLMVAIMNGQEAITKYLISQRETDVNWKNKLGATALHYAADKGQLPLLKALCTHPECETQTIFEEDKNGKSPLVWVVMGGQETTVRHFLDKRNMKSKGPQVFGNPLLNFRAQKSHQQCNNFSNRKTEEVMWMCLLHCIMQQRKGIYKCLEFFMNILQQTHRPFPIMARLSSPQLQ